jgi:hypothetical protein
MEERSEPNEMANMAELLISIVHTQKALLNLLDKKGILTKKEVLDETKFLRAEYEAKQTEH